MPRVNLPPGCYGLRLPTREVNSKPGGAVTVTDQEARWIAKSGNGRLGIVSGSPATAIATKRGMWCFDCVRLWNAWNALCPRCGEPTEPEQED